MTHHILAWYDEEDITVASDLDALPDRNFVVLASFEDEAEAVRVAKFYTWWELED